MFIALPFIALLGVQVAEGTTGNIMHDDGFSLKL